MRLLKAVLLILGVTVAEGARLRFLNADALVNALANVKEVNELRPQDFNSTLGTLQCIDDDNGATAITKVEDGQDFISTRLVNPRDLSTVQVFAKQQDYEDKSQDFAQQNQRKVSIGCRSLVDSTSILFEGNLVLIDVNDKIPVFDRNESYRTEMNEFLFDEILPLRIYSRNSKYPIRVLDEDKSPNNNLVTAECVSMTTKTNDVKQPCDGYFSVEAESDAFGVYYFNIYALRDDYSGEESYTLEIRAVNEPQLPGEQTLNSITQNVNIIIRDLQNLDPLIDKDTLSFEMREDLQPGEQLVGYIAAFDQDVGDPNAIRYMIIMPELVQRTDSYAFENALFRLGDVDEDPNQPNQYIVPLIVNKEVDREAIPDSTKYLYLGIKAQEYDLQNRTDRQTGSAVDRVTIKIEDVNDRGPVFSEDMYVIEITELDEDENANPENFRQISNTIDIQVEDKDSSAYNGFTIDIVSGNMDGNFKLDRSDGSSVEIFSLLAKEKVLDYEVQPNFYMLELKAVDINQPTFTSTAKVNITITDANDHSPEFAMPTVVFNVLETASVLSSVGTVSATDKDSGRFGRITEYTIIGDDSKTFSISQTGDITLQKPLDYETRDSYYFSVIAFDGALGNNRREGTINIIVQVNNVIDIGPEFLSTYTATLREESLTLIPNVIIQAESREIVPGSVEYAIESVQPNTIAPGTFTIDRFDGELTVNRFVDFKDTDPNRPGIINLNISATAGGLSAYTIVTITITDINNFAPEFIPRVPNNIYRTEVSESAIAGEDVYDLNVEDRDGADNDNGRVTFQILSGANDGFLITADSGIIKVSGRAELDFNEQKNYTIVVLARDKGNPPKSSSATVLVSLLDANNKNPEFVEALYRFQMHADDPVDHTIGTVAATDLDIGSRLEYNISYPSVRFEKQANPITDSVDPRTVLKMNPTTGEIQVAGPIMREKYDRINLNVVAQDVAAPTLQTATASVVIFILAAVDPTIYFTNGGWDKIGQTIPVTVTESRARELQILTLVAVDPEIPANINNFRKVPTSDPEDYFQLSGSYLYVKKPLDYEELPAGKKVSVVIEAISDNGLKTSTATIDVAVQDLNDNPPVFEEDRYLFTVEEDKKAPTPVGTIRASDRDTGSYGQVEFTLLGAQGDFRIYMDPFKKNEAVIYVAENATLDFETKAVYNLVVQASDNVGGQNTVKFVADAAVDIQVLDKNDLSPEFTEAVYNISIVGTKEVNGDVFYIRAIDGDAGINGQVDYFIVDSTNDGQNYFGIETEDQLTNNFGEVFQLGRIFVRSSLENLPDRAMFVLTVNARDRGNPPTLPGSCKVIITVSKGVQDLKPKWDENLRARVQIEEERPANTFVAKLTAYPNDVTSSITYSFVRAGDALRDYDSFNINPTTGEITTRVVLDFEEQRIYNLLVLATDSVNNTLTNQFLLIVQVLDVDDNRPSFADCPGKVYNMPETARVDESLPPEVYVYRAEACDQDDPPLNTVSYSWFIDNDYCSAESMNAFTLNQNTGQVFTKVMLDREDKAEYMLCIEASKPDQQNTERDLAALNRTNKILFVKVTVNDVNDLGPKFYEPRVKTVILQYPTTEISVAEAYDNDLPPNNGIRYSIDNIDFTIKSKTQNAPTAFTINSNDGTIVIGTNDYTDYVGGYFDITVKAEDYNGANVPHDTQLQRVYVTDRSNRVRVVFDEPADEGVDQKAKNMIRELNEKYGDSGMYFEIETISYHVVSNNADPSFDKTDVCLVVVEDEAVLSGVRAITRLTESDGIQDTLEKYGAVEPGSCDPAMSVYPVGWESYWWVLVAFAIFIFVCCVILIFMICVLFRQYRQYMDSRKTYLVAGDRK